MPRTSDARPCEGCDEPATRVCHGLDVPAWRFCDACMEEHKKVCKDLANGRACVEELDD